MIEAGLIGARFLHYVALVLLFGGWAYAGFCNSNCELSRRFGRLVVGSALLVLTGSAAVLAATVAGLGGAYASLADTSLWATVVGETDFGRIWAGRLVLAILSMALAITWARTHGPALRLAGLILAGTLVVTIAWTGHAAIEEGMTGLLHRSADALHLIAAAVWLGALIPLLWQLGRDGSSIEAARRLTRFHAVGVAAVLTLIATGLVNSLFLVGEPAALLTTRYGQLLLLKLALFGGMLGLSARNSLLLTPALVRAVSLSSDPDAVMADLRRSITTELILGLLILAIVAALGAIEPASAV